MSDRTGITRQLLAKELQQLMPLMGMLLGVGVTLIVLWSALFTGGRSMGMEGIPLLLPTLFAAGAAAVLVGQEKEQGTLQWLSSLPGSPARLIGTKLLAGCIGLAAMWIVCWLLIGLLSLFDPGAGNTGGLDTLSLLLQMLLYLHVHSLFILLCGFYSAWRINNTFVAILAIFPLAAIPFVVLQAGYALRQAWFGYRYIDPAPAGLISFVVTSLSILLVGWLGYRAARRYLDPAPPPRLSGGAAAWIDAWRVGSAPAPQSAPFQFSITSLVWQSVHHNRLALSGILLMILAGSAGLLLYVSFEPAGGDPIALVCLLAVALGISFLGVFVFAGDGSDRKLRFLAERGVSPSRVWLGRQLIGLAVLSAFLSVYNSLVPGITEADNGVSSYLPSTGLVSLLAFTLYSVSQWAGQWIRSLAASAFLAPTVSLLAVWWLGFSALELDTPLWLILLAGLLPLVATWLLMGRFMEGTRRLSIYLSAAVIVALVLTLPAVPVAVELSKIPGMPDEYQEEFSAAAIRSAKTIGTRAPLPIALIPLTEDDFDAATALSPEETVVILQQKTYRPADILSLPNNDTNPWSMDPYVVEHAIETASYVKLRFLADPKDESTIDTLTDWIGSLTRIARRLRASERWYDQEMADSIEIWLTQNLADPRVAPLHERDVYRGSLRHLADAEGRSRARRRAVVSSWRRAIDDEASPLIDRFGSQGSQGTTKALLMQERIKEAIVGAALQMLDAGEAGKSTEPMRRQLHQLVVGPRIDFRDGPYADRLRASAASIPATPAGRMALHPCTQWFASWEKGAESLAEKHLRGDADDQDELPGESK